MKLPQSSVNTTSILWISSGSDCPFPCRQSCKTNWSSNSLTSDNGSHSETWSHYQTLVRDKSHRRTAQLLGQEQIAAVMQIYKHTNTCTFGRNSNHTHISVVTAVLESVHLFSGECHCKSKNNRRSSGYIPLHGNSSHVCRAWCEYQGGTWYSGSNYQASRSNSILNAFRYWRKTRNYSMIQQIFSIWVSNTTSHPKKCKISNFVIFFTEESHARCDKS